MDKTNINALVQTDFGAGLLPNMVYGMRGILMSIFIDFNAFKRSLFKCNRNNFFVWEVLDGCLFGLESIN